MEVGAVNDGDLIQVCPFINQVMDALGHKGCLCARGIERNNSGQETFSLTRRSQLLSDLDAIWSNGCICQGQHLRHATVVGLNLVSVGSRIAVSKAENVPHIRSPPRVDGLGVITHSHEISVSADNGVDELTLKLVGILILINEHKLELSLVALTQVLVFHQQSRG